MKIQDLKPAKGSKKARKRVGRGDASGTGGTAGRGHKGQKSRSGGSIRTGFEGGQTPLYRRVPKLRGFKNAFKKEYAVINVSELNKFDDGTEVTLDLLKEQGVVKDSYKLLKVLGNGDVQKKVTVRAHKVSKTAEDKLQKAGVKVEIVQ